MLNKEKLSEKKYSYKKNTKQSEQEKKFKNLSIQNYKRVIS